MGMNTSILICSLVYGGCGHVGKSTEWNSDPYHDSLPCPICLEDHTFQLTNENFDSLTEGMSKDGILKARGLLAEYYA